MLRALCLAPFLFASACFAGDATPDPLKLMRLDTSGVAIDGYSPVSYFERGRAEVGDPQYAVQHHGVTYHLTDAGQVAQFEADPDRYVPAHGGWCSLMLSGSGRRTPANPESFKIVDGKLLLFWDGIYQGQHVSGLANWSSKTDDDPKKESRRLRKADKTWEKILAGKKRAPVVLFAESDRDRVAPHHLDPT